MQRDEPRRAYADRPGLRNARISSVPAAAIRAIAFILRPPRAAPSLRRPGVPSPVTGGRVLGHERDRCGGGRQDARTTKRGTDLADVARRDVPTQAGDVSCLSDGLDRHL